MTKKELVEKLKDYPDDMEVCVGCDYEGDYCIQGAIGKADRVEKCFNVEKYELLIYAEKLKDVEY